MATNDLLFNFATELSSRLEQFGFRKGPIRIEPGDREQYCTVARLKVADARSNVFAFQGPYLGGEQALWAGFGSRSAAAIDLLQAGTDPTIQFCSIRYDDWNDYVLPPTMMRKVARCQNFAREDYRKDTNWIWLGRYFRPHKAAASKAAAFITPAARPLLFDDDSSKPVGDGPTEKKVEAKRRLVQSAFREEVARRAKGCCVVTGCTTPAALRASHILSWKENPKLRANPDNGLYLVGTLDARFDRGRISFDKKHRIMISDVIPIDEWKRLGLTKELCLVMKPTPRQEEFLRRHREYKFVKF
jgi:HNH endonuclease